jgi:hypothetical protein
MSDKNVFDVIKNINVNKNEEIRNEMISLYDLFVINKSFSLYSDTIFYANVMNMNSHISKKMQYDYYINSIKKRNRWVKWPKKKIDNDAIINFIENHLNMNYKNAANISKILTTSEISEIRKENKNE